MIQPLNDRVLVERIEDKEKIGAIFIPDIAREKSFKGKVLAVGPGKREKNGVRRPLAVSVGQTVLFNSRWDDLTSGYEKPTSHQDRLHLIQEADIIGIIG